MYVIDFLLCTEHTLGKCTYFYHKPGLVYNYKLRIEQTFKKFLVEKHRNHNKYFLKSKKEPNLNMNHPIAFALISQYTWRLKVKVIFVLFLLQLCIVDEIRIIVGLFCRSKKINKDLICGENFL